MGAYVIASGFFSVFGMCVDTLFLCFREWRPPCPLRVQLGRRGSERPAGATARSSPGDRPGETPGNPGEVRARGAVGAGPPSGCGHLSRAAQGACGPRTGPRVGRASRSLLTHEGTEPPRGGQREPPALTPACAQWKTWSGTTARRPGPTSCPRRSCRFSARRTTRPRGPRGRSPEPAPPRAQPPLPSAQVLVL